MKNKKIILISIIILTLSFTLSGCSTISELKTETIVANYLKSEDGPEKVIAQSFDKLLEEFSKNDSLKDYNWSYSLDFDKVNIVDAKADADGSGVLTAENIILVYDYQLSGEPKDNALNSISRGGSLTFNINKLKYDDNKEELLNITSTQAERPSESPKIYDLSSDNSDGFTLTAKTENINTDSALGVISLGSRNFSASSNRVLDITTNQLALNTELTLAESDFASLLLINYDELKDNNSEQTGLASFLISAP